MSADAIDLIIGAEPAPRVGVSGAPGVALAVALARAGALPVLQLGQGAFASIVAAFTSRTDSVFAVALPTSLAVGDGSARAALPPAASTLLLDASTVCDLVTTGSLEAAIARWAGLRMLAEVTSLEQARAAVRAGAQGLIAKGCESGGRVGSTETFILLQQTVDLGVPVWARGGIGLHTAAGAVALGARGVVLDAQLALVRESNLARATRDAIAAMDGSETRVVGEHRVYTRPDLAVAGRAANEPPSTIAAELGPDIAADLVPIGQDGAMAFDLARRFKTAGGVVEAVRHSIAEHMSGAAEHLPLGPRAGIAKAHGLRYPVAQGPMTRVSDRAAFAAAVAKEGGLPFLALALLRGSEVEPLLEETAALLAGRPWGVGILGFVPPELREEQLAAVQRARPPVALIAGGRPSQAAPLEEAGIATYLHVPSPGLLDLFLKDGARRFVFEGRECGGHVGPRASFPLWEAQVERLCAVSDTENLHVLFAGGIHDPRSAAAVAAIGAPLAARGACLGVLMGTGYLFTHEAVASGAITPGFQDAALACERTVLLETAPGHSTRCAETAYVRTFAEARAELEADEMSPKEMWAQLESLNLGRLRVASKGLARRGEGIVPVDGETQRREGMYMLGQVGTLRHELTTIAELHHGVSSASSDLVRRLAVESRPRRATRARVPPPLDVAIVGMASLFPGSTTAEEFWGTIVSGVNSITEVPKSRWDPARYFDPDATTGRPGRKTPSKWGGFLTAIGFDPLAYGIPPASLAAIEPAQLLSLEVAARALADAGYEDREFDRSRAAVIFGVEGGNDLSGAYGLRALLPQALGELPPELDEFLPALTEDSFPGVLPNVIAGRIANRLNLGGINCTVDAACAASLAAVDAACKELLAGNSDVVLCGAADLHNGINDYLLFSAVHALSPTGQCRTFDACADGIALGEGIACVVLKRREDAERDGDRIYAVIQAVAASSDGRHLGLTAPRKEGQQLALARAHAQARRSATDLGLVEAHGTGTVVGDRTELVALSEVWAEHDAGAGKCVLGSVKSQIGHTKCAAGLAGLIKVASSLYRGVLPPTCNLTTPNAAYDATTSPFRFLDGARPWAAEERHGGVSAFGFGGSNFHAVLSSYGGADGPAHGVDTWPAELFLFRAERLGDALGGLERFAATIAAILREDPAAQRHRLRDLAAAIAADGAGPVQVAIVATGLADLADKLAAALRRAGDRGGVFLADDAAVPGDSQAPLAFLYPGQGSQRTGMLAELFVTFPHLRSLLVAGAAWSEALYPAAAFTADERKAQAAAITDTRVAQPVLGLCGLAMTRLLASVGVEPDVAAGHSYGELVALAAAGALEPEGLFELSQARGQAIVDAAAALGEDAGTMAAVSAPLETVLDALQEHPQVVVANHNGPMQAVISGASKAVAAAAADLAARGIPARAVEVACAFHSPLVAAATDSFALELATVVVAAPRIPVWANTTAARYPASPEVIRKLLAEQIARPVRFVDQIESMYEAGVRVFVEAGPGRVLTQLVDKILGDRPHRAIATDVPGEHGVQRLLLALAELAVAGIPVQTDALFKGRTVNVVLGELPAPAPGWLVDGHLVRKVSGEVVEGSLRPSDEFPTLALGGVTQGSNREATVLEYLRGLREMVAAEREVMLRFLGDTSKPSELSMVIAPATSVPPSEVAPLTAAPATAASQPVRGEALVAAVVGVVADRTGYPTDMLDLDLDLEADLSIDSIKRVEIVGELAERIGLDARTHNGVDDAALEALAQLRTLRKIVGWIEELGSARPSTAAVAATEAQERDGEEWLELPTAAVRHTVSNVAVAGPSGRPRRLDGTAIVIADDGRGVAAAVAAALEQWGATVAVVAADGPPGAADDGLLAGADALIWLRALHPGGGEDPFAFDALAAFAWWQPALLGRTTSLVVATSGGGSWGVDSAGLGLAGMAKTIRRELSERTVRIVDLDASDDPADLAAYIVDEFFDDDVDLLEVGYEGLQRVTRVVRPDPLPCATPLSPTESLLRSNGSAPVVLLTGGARGITALAAAGLARHSGCRMELAGRSPLPVEREDEATSAAVDLPVLRRALIDTGRFTTPAAIEAQCARILAAREIRATLSALGELGCEARYHELDVRDGDALAALVGDIHARHGRLDLVVHGAGVLDDHHLRDKTRESFERVFTTKVAAARTLLEVTDPSTTLVFFGSVSGVFGNRGQVDYAAANAALDELAVGANRVRSGRVVSIDWGPWAGTGMVSPELEREYCRRGIGLIDPEEGVRILLDELAAPSRVGQVVVMRARPDAMAPEMQSWSRHAEAMHS